MFYEEDVKLNYPRPQFIRKEWFDLNGEWDFDFDDLDIGEKEQWYEEKEFNKKIIVPFCYQSKLSGIGDKSNHEIVWYKRTFDFKLLEKNITFIRFEAIDYKTKVWINKKYVGVHDGGYVPFKFDITNHLINGKNEIVIRAIDENNCDQLIGKQSWKRNNFLCWYTRTTGIWQSVWMETVNDFHIESVKIIPNIDKSIVEIEAYLVGGNVEGYFEARISFRGEFIRRAGISVKNNKVNLSIDVSFESPDFRVEYWSPDTPNLYDITFVLSDANKITDYVESYFGMRKVSTKNQKVLLNNKEFYQKLILDQGYYGDGIMTPKSIDDLINDLIKIKDMGFNGVRKHQKVEDNKYMYLCDKLGLVMWAEIPSSFEFSDKSIGNVIKDIPEIIKKHYNHPCVIIYTLLNESWGVNEIYANEKQQSLANSVYYLAKSLDNSRLIIGNDGWEHTISDILTIHDYNSEGELIRKMYADKNKLVNGSPSITSKRQNYCEGYRYRNEPIIISEYGGIGYSNIKNSKYWGYGNRPKNKEEVIERIKNITHAIMDIDDVCGFCYTQLSDVEQEINGLLDERHEYKFDPKAIREILNYKHTNGFTFQ